uniref:Uncharacterized protein n=1 Tax=Oncorhynchus mykiss TaxID=8022 RepID=A0A8C7QTI4_ONCMY
KALLMKLHTSTVNMSSRWLHEEAQKEGRRAMEGLISLFVGDKAAVMVEVSRSHSLNEILSLILLNAVCKQKFDSHLILFTEDLSKLNLGEGASLADQLALTVGRGAGHTGRKLRHPVVGEAPISLGSTDDLPCRDTETRLLAQFFLPDSSRTVAQYLTEQGARVVDFNGQDSNKLMLGPFFCAYLPE